MFFSRFAKQNQAGVWPRFQSLLNPLAISRANGIGKLSRCGLPRTQRFQLLTPKNPLGYLPFPRFNHPFRKRPCPWWKSQSVSRVRLNFLIMRIPMKEMLIGARGPPRPALTRVCVPARCLWLFLDKFEMEVFVVSPNLLSIYYTKS